MEKILAQKIIKGKPQVDEKGKPVYMSFSQQEWAQIELHYPKTFLKKESKKSKNNAE